MSDCTHIREELGGYVLDALEPPEMEAVRCHIAVCATCAGEHAQLADLPALLDLLPADDAPAATPPPGLEDRLLDQFARERRRAAVGGAPRRRWRRARLAIATAATAALAAGAAVIVLSGGEDRPAGSYYRVALEPTSAATGASARAGLWREPYGTRVRLRISGLPPDPAVVYELMCERADGSAVSAGTFRVDAAGHADVRLTTAARIGEYARLRVVRRAGGISAASEPADVLVGRLL